MQPILSPALSCHYLWHAELIMLRDHSMWHWPLNVASLRALPLEPRSVQIRQMPQPPAGELCGPSLLCNRRYTLLWHMSKWEKMKIWSTQVTPLPSHLCAFPLSGARSITLPVSSQWASTCTRAMDFQTRQQSDNVLLISWNWKMTGGQTGDVETEPTCQSVTRANLIWTQMTEMFTPMRNYRLGHCACPLCR